MTYLLIALVACCAGIVQSITGFGAAIILMLYLPAVLPLLQAAAVSSAVALALGLSIGVKLLKYAKPSLLLLPAGLYLLFSMSAITYANRLNLDGLIIAFGCFMMALSLWSVFKSKIKLKSGILAASIYSSISGMTSGLFGIGGPLMAMYYLECTKDKREYMATTQCFFAITNIVNLGMRCARGIYTLELIPVTLIGIAGISIGKVIGLFVFNRVNAKNFSYVVYGMIGFSGLLSVLTNSI